MIRSMTEKKQASYSFEILREPKHAQLRETKKGVTIWVCVTIWRH